MKKLSGEFSESFIDADEIIVTDVYAAREKAMEGLVQRTWPRLLCLGESCRHISFEQAVDFK